MYNDKTGIATYEDYDGTLIINFRNKTIHDQLDHDLINSEGMYDPKKVYERIMASTFDDGENGELFGYGYDYTNNGVEATLAEYQIFFDKEGVRFDG